jgi:REP element-mobilizing transposase RayT
MGRKYTFHDPLGLYFITLTVVSWVDLFTRPCYVKILVDNLNYCSTNKGLKIHAYCIMTNHLHLIVSADESNSLPDIVRDFKGYTSKKLFQKISSFEGESRKKWMLNHFVQQSKLNTRNKNFQIWHHDNHPVELITSYMIYQRIEYIHNNPVVAGYVDDPNHWKWSSCREYELLKKGDILLHYL